MYRELYQMSITIEGGACTFAADNSQGTVIISQWRCSKDIYSLNYAFLSPPEYQGLQAIHYTSWIIRPSDRPIIILTSLISRECICHQSKAGGFWNSPLDQWTTYWSRVSYFIDALKSVLSLTLYDVPHLIKSEPNTSAPAP